MRHPRVRLVWLVMVTAAAGCTDTVFERIPDFEDPPNAAMGFLGYTDSEADQPVCGNCHVGKYAEWRGTAHADAWDDLQASGAAAESCEGCHTVGENGNPVEVTDVAWTATGDPRYHDVQCESCHGPGLDHVTNPDATQPLARLDVGDTLQFGCGECHRGDAEAHHPFIEDWTLSAHGKRGTSMQTRESCVACHEGRAALEVWGVDAEYVEKDEAEPLPVTCGVCHDPHDATNPGQLRFPVGVADVDRNLCMRCHQKRAVPDPGGSSRGPHSPQGPLLLGEDVGWTPPNFAYDDTRIVSTHGTERNPRLCATCHVTAIDFTDANGVTISASGHLFKAIPCLDEDGLPTASEACTLGERSFASCTPSGCHGDQNAARSAYISSTDEIAGLVADLDALLDQVPADQFANDTIFTIAEGAEFNAGLGDITSSAIHNPFLTEALLRASIQAVMDEYGVAGRAAVAGSGGKEADR
ncbi:MAG TPA: multiheme c-type cytochrome [Longimicrobiales bacterium]|nr:multiheme c-type cytochrome [Longimicrobiales bacterium]